MAAQATTYLPKMSRAVITETLSLTFCTKFPHNSSKFAKTAYQVHTFGVVATETIRNVSAAAVATPGYLKYYNDTTTVVVLLTYI